MAGLPPRPFTAVRMAARSTRSGTPVKSCKTMRATTKGISSSAGAFAFQFARVSTSRAWTFFPSQLRSTDSRTMRMLTGSFEIGPTPASSRAGREWSWPVFPFPRSKERRVLNGVVMGVVCLNQISGPLGNTDSKARGARPCGQTRMGPSALGPMLRGIRLF